MYWTSVLPDVSLAVVLVLFPDIRSNELISAPIGKPVTGWVLESARTLMRTLSHLSPSMRSSPPRAVIRSEPAPPKMKLPESNDVM